MCIRDRLKVGAFFFSRTGKPYVTMRGVDQNGIYFYDFYLKIPDYRCLLYTSYRYGVPFFLYTHFNWNCYLLLLIIISYPIPTFIQICAKAVSYTHLDVYKRQLLYVSPNDFHLAKILVFV